MMIVVCLGLPRSGSTLQFNIVSMLAVRQGWNVMEWTKNSDLVDALSKQLSRADAVVVFKTHSVPDGLSQVDSSIKVLTTFRDFRDVAASNKVAFDNTVDRTISVLKKALQDLKAVQEMDIPIYTGQYHEFKDNIFEEAKLIGDFLGIEVSDELATEIEASCNVDKAFTASKSDKVGFLQTLKRRALLFLGVAPYKDKTLRLHHNHVSDRKGATNYYQDVLTSSEIQAVENELAGFSDVLGARASSDQQKHVESGA